MSESDAGGIVAEGEASRTQRHGGAVETCGAIAAATAAVVPIFNASRRVIFSAMETLYSPGATGRQHFFRERERLLRKCAIIQLAPGEIARASAFATNFFQEPV